VGGRRGRRRQVRRRPAVLGAGAPRGRRGVGGGEGLRVLDGVVGVHRLAALALARVVEVDRVGNVAVVVPVAELGDVSGVLLLLLHGCKWEKNQKLPRASTRLNTAVALVRNTFCDTTFFF
jgi:hypothetical protein